MAFGFNGLKSSAGHEIAFVGSCMLFAHGLLVMSIVMMIVGQLSRFLWNISPVRGRVRESLSRFILILNISCLNFFPPAAGRFETSEAITRHRLFSGFPRSAGTIQKRMRSGDIQPEKDWRPMPGCEEQS